MPVLGLSVPALVLHSEPSLPYPNMQLDSVGSVFLINLMQCSLQLAARLSDRGADDLWMSTLYGARGAEAINARYVR